MIFPIKIYKISGHSMGPKIKEGSFVLVWCWTRNFKVGDIVAFKINATKHHGLPDEALAKLGRDNPYQSTADDLRGRSNLYQSPPSIFDGRQKRKDFDNKSKIFIKRVAAINNNQIEVRGDNQADSLEVGPVDPSLIIGKVIGK